MNPNRPQVSSPLPCGAAIVKVHTVKGVNEKKGTLYLFPGFEEFDLVLLKPSGSKQKATKQYWRVYEAETGYRIAEVYSDRENATSTIEQALQHLTGLGRQKFADRIAGLKQRLLTANA